MGIFNTFTHSLDSKELLYDRYGVEFQRYDTLQIYILSNQLVDLGIICHLTQSVVGVSGKHLIKRSYSMYGSLIVDTTFQSPYNKIDLFAVQMNVGWLYDVKRFVACEHLLFTVSIFMSVCVNLCVAFNIPESHWWYFVSSLLKAIFHLKCLNCDRFQIHVHTHTQIHINWIMRLKWEWKMRLYHYKCTKLCLIKFILTELNRRKKKYWIEERERVLWNACHSI